MQLKFAAPAFRPPGRPRHTQYNKWIRHCSLWFGNWQNEERGFSEDIIHSYLLYSIRFAFDLDALICF